MMPRRSIAAIAAVLLAVFGAVVIISYVRGADSRAQAGEELVDVLVVDDQVAAGTPAGDLSGSVSVEQVPARLLATDAVTDLSSLEGMVVSAPLVPGDQVVTTRFADPAALAPEGTVLAPEGMVEVSMALDAQRAVGGVLRAGDKVGVQLTSQGESGSGITAYTVYRVFDDVLVTRVDGPESNDDPAATYLVTLALSKEDAATVLLGTTSQSVWLSLQESPVGAASTVADDTTLTATLGDDK
jgi:pilus assembly protein CpaB